MEVDAEDPEFKEMVVGVSGDFEDGFSTPDFDDVGLVKEVQKYPNLYNKTNVLFSDQTARWNSWAEIGKKLQLPAEEVEKKFRSYRQEYSKVKKAIKKRPGSSKARRAYTWHLFNPLRFLDPFMTERTRRSSSLTKGSEYDRDFVYVEKAATSTRSDWPVAEENSVQAQAERTSGWVNGLKELTASTSKRSSSCNLATASNTEDAEAIFGKYLAAELRQLSERDRALVKLKIQEMLFSVKISALGCTTPQPPEESSNNGYSD